MLLVIKTADYDNMYICEKYNGLIYRRIEYFRDFKSYVFESTLPEHELFLFLIKHPEFILLKNDSFK